MSAKGIIGIHDEPSAKFMSKLVAKHTPEVVIAKTLEELMRHVVPGSESSGIFVPPSWIYMDVNFTEPGQLHLVQGSIVYDLLRVHVEAGRTNFLATTSYSKLVEQACTIGIPTVMKGRADVSTLLTSHEAYKAFYETIRRQA